MKLGVLGAGVIAFSPVGYFAGLKRMGEQAVLEAVCDPIEAHGQRAKQEYGFKAVYSRLDDMLERADVEAVINLTPIPVHGKTSLEILDSGRHLVVEKPIATTMEEADQIIDLARERRLTVVVAPPNMLQPNRQEAQRIVQEGAIGKVAFARVRSSHGGPAAGNWPLDPTWFYQEGSGPLFDMGVYGIHDITGILGPAKRVVAFSGITEPVRYVRGGPFKGKRIDVTADDNTLLMLDFGGATFAVVDGTFNVNAAKAPQVEIFGRAGTINLNNDRDVQNLGLNHIEVFKLDAVPGLDGWITPRERSFDTRWQRQRELRRAVLVDHLIECVREGKKPVLSAEHARHALEIMLKAIESARTGRAIELRTTFEPVDAWS
ncbi:MAG TPA: Gfo/Idh/MocA family oxidoreductase [Chloroflexota bacterium]|nr:Gfo/Idh/MocA family oxidoreductase [Chloroflexota bacterium]